MIEKNILEVVPPHHDILILSCLFVVVNVECCFYALQEIRSLFSRCQMRKKVIHNVVDCSINAGTLEDVEGVRREKR